jgi:hypothetical protein
MRQVSFSQTIRIISVAAVILLGLSVTLGNSIGVAAAQAVTPTPGDDQIQLPTNTPTLVGGPTATPTRTPTIAPVIAEVIEQANLRTRPSIDAEIVATLGAGTSLPVIGRWIGYDWLLVVWAEAPGGQAWVHITVVNIIGEITTVPAVTPPPQPTIEPTLAALNATATVILQTPGGAETATAQALLAPTGIYTVTPGGPGVIPGSLPTFTPPPAYVQPETLIPPETSAQARRGPAPAVLIIGLGGMGILTLAVGLLRRL